MESPWFSPPGELLPAPGPIVGREPRRARRPPALVQPAPNSLNGKRAKPNPALAAGHKDPVGVALPDRAKDVPRAVHLRHGRYLTNGRVVAVPQKPEDWPDGLVDDKNELLVVELTAPGGLGWFEDPEVSHVRVAAGHGPCRLVPIAPIREIVRAKVNLFARPAPAFKKLNTPCRLKQCPAYLLALLAVSELEPLLTAADVEEES
jgi:hypothetical protein